MRLTWADTPQALPGTGFFASAPWYRIVAANGLPPGTSARFALALQGERPVAQFALLMRGQRCLGGLTTPYTCLQAPAIAADARPHELVAATRMVARACRGGLARFDCLPDGTAPGLLAAGARRAGLVPLRFEHFAAWQEDVAGLDWDAYLARRPGQLRTTLARKERRHGADLALQVVEGGPDLEPGIAAYQAVYERSWKPEEPYPDFNAALMREAAACGALRLGLLWQGDVPVAAQLWVVWEGHATVLKLAHDGTRDALSPGTVLTARMIARLLRHDRVRRIDFGRGDDPYKRDWAGERSMRMGVLLADPLRPAGMAAVLRHVAGGMRRGSR